MGRWLKRSSVLAAALAALTAGLVLSSQLVHPSKINVVYQPHAVAGSHAADALGVRRCLENQGPYQVWKDNLEKDKFYLLCQVDDGRWGLMAIVKEAETWIEKTAFVPRDGAWQSLLRYLTDHGATRFTGELAGLLH